MSVIMRSSREKTALNYHDTQPMTSQPFQPRIHLIE
jgi:hypothetical protein